MPREFKLPDLGEGVAEGEIMKWLVSEGEEIKEDQPMVEVMTDKATVQIPSPTTGKVKQILAKEGQIVKVGTTIVVLDTDGQNQSVQPQPSEPGKKSQQPATQQAAKTEQRMPAGPSAPQAKAIATPATRKLARELDVDIDTLQGTGPGGRVTEEDVRKATSGRGIRQQQEVAGQQELQGRQVEQMRPQTAPTPQAMTVSRGLQATEREEHIPLHGIRKRIAEKMARSKRTAAHVTHIDEVDFTELITLREKLKPIAQEDNVKLTFLPFIMKAAVVALKQYPYFNASLDEEKQEIVLKHYFNIGFAADTPNGLIVPVVKEADKKSILQIARDIEELSARAREGKVSLEDIQGGTFTVTNIGTLGGMISTPIINVPEVAILGVHKIAKKPVVRDNQIVIRDVAFVALSFDHRVVDGADAARFTSTLIRVLESPGLMVLDGVRFY